MKQTLEIFALVGLFFFATNGAATPTFAQNESKSAATNPNIWADVPDMALLRVGDDYYMSSTTMHMAPGVPMMKSKNLVDWTLVSYASERLGDDDALSLKNSKNAYGVGTWASSLRWRDGVFYVSTFSNTTGKTHVYSTRDVENEPWREISFVPALHDHSLFFDDDGKAYMLTGQGNMRLVELKSDLSGIAPNGFDEIVIRDAGKVAGGRIGLAAEGSQIFKRNGKYYVCCISWPQGDMRTQIIFRADSLKGPYEGRVIFKDRGIAQGTLIDSPDGKWFAYLFRDSGAVGRIPYLIPVEWVDDWPILGVDGKAPQTLPIEKTGSSCGNIVESDEFSRSDALLAKLSESPKTEVAIRRGAFPLAWQWNHLPDDRFWSLSERPGWLRLTSGRVDSKLEEARNTLTQRTFGPTSSATTSLDASRLKDGDYAGLTAFQRRYGFVGVKRENGKNSIVVVQVDKEEPVEKASVPFDGDVVYLRVDCDFRPLDDETSFRDEANFFWSLDGENWTPIGPTLKMRYTLPHFMGYRFGLFHFATKEPGGAADFDFYRISPNICDLKN